MSKGIVKIKYTNLKKYTKLSYKMKNITQNATNA